MGRPTSMTFHFSFLNFFSPICFLSFSFNSLFFSFVLLTFTIALSFIVYLTFFNCRIVFAGVEYHNHSLVQIHFTSLSDLVVEDTKRNQDAGSLSKPSITVRGTIQRQMISFEKRLMLSRASYAILGGSILSREPHSPTIQGPMEKSPNRNLVA